MKLNKKFLLEKYHKREAKKQRLVKRIILTRNLLDEDGYPTVWAGLCVRNWPNEQPKEWLDFIGQLWHFKTWGWDCTHEPHEYYQDKMVYRYHVSTAGWSGNEYLIGMMQKHEWLWHEVWVQSRRGGHYIFDVDESDANG